MSLLKALIKGLLVLVIVFVTGCSALTQPSSSKTDTKKTDDLDTTAQLSSAGTKVNLSYEFSNVLDKDLDGTVDFSADYSQTYSLPVYILADGTVTAWAKDFPTMIYRICKTMQTDCDAVYNQLPAEGVDLVLDACGVSVKDAGCGANDLTTFSGSINKNGELLLRDVSMRSRVFFVGETTNGYTQNSADQGAYNLDRILLTLTTGLADVGSLSNSGVTLKNNEVTLVTGGTLSEDTPLIPGAAFSATLLGTFDTDPLELLGK